MTSWSKPPVANFLTTVNTYNAPLRSAATSPDALAIFALCNGALRQVSRDREYTGIEASIPHCDATPDANRRAARLLAKVQGPLRSSRLGAALLARGGWLGPDAALSRDGGK